MPRAGLACWPDTHRVQGQEDRSHLGSGSTEETAAEQRGGPGLQGHTGASDLRQRQAFRESADRRGRHQGQEELGGFVFP